MSEIEELKIKVKSLEDIIDALQTKIYNLEASNSKRQELINDLMLKLGELHVS